ncbi:rab effector MyRIP-like isoform X2 [Gigantopelta aegis]|uniref:rab effector MyRIP-like isoform X2 n=1 Tax=Gigantopelta aegis TaxID=1735272 RepID=UPI001B889102|nr:rab effector MyRIP-like isoform X2 [Gigantopelta aegis]
MVNNFEKETQALMGRKLNLSHLTEEESEQILQVIQKDFELRQKEKQRLSVIEDVVQQEEEKAKILSKQKEFNENCCIRCCKIFGFIFNRKQECKVCGFFICKNCGKYMDQIKGYVCNKCLTEHNLKLKSCDWFYSTVGQRFRRFGSAKVVRSLYKSDSEVDSGYDPSYFNNSLPHSPVKTRPSLQNVFDIHPSHDDSGKCLLLYIPRLYFILQ